MNPMQIVRSVDGSVVPTGTMVYTAAWGAGSMHSNGESWIVTGGSASNAFIRLVKPDATVVNITAPETDGWGKGTNSALGSGNICILKKRYLVGGYSKAYSLLIEEDGTMIDNNVPISCAGGVAPNSDGDLLYRSGSQQLTRRYYDGTYSSPITLPLIGANVFYVLNCNSKNDVLIGNSTIGNAYPIIVVHNDNSFTETYNSNTSNMLEMANATMKDIGIHRSGQQFLWNGTSNTWKKGA
jgi:hypothetical protein